MDEENREDINLNWCTSWIKHEYKSFLNKCFTKKKKFQENILKTKGIILYTGIIFILGKTDFYKCIEIHVWSAKRNT